MSKIQPINPYNNAFANFKVPNIPYASENKPKKELTNRQKTNIALTALTCAIIPIVLLNGFKKGRMSEVVDSFKNKLPLKDKFKAIWSLFEIESYSQICATTIGGLTGGLLSGLKYAQSKEEKESKYKEAIFEFLNIMTPTTLVATGLSLAKKVNKDKSIPVQAGIILSSVAGGMFIANKASNKIYEKMFDKDKKEKDIRKFKPTDCLVHIDDLVNLAVLTRIPLASKLQVDKLLPLIFARSGFEVGVAGKKKDK